MPTHQYKLGPHKGQFDPASSLSVQQRSAETRKDHSYLMPGNQRYVPPQVELEIRQGLYMLPSELAARGFVVTRGKWQGSGLPVLPEIRYHSWMGKSYVGFSVR